MEPTCLRFAVVELTGLRSCYGSFDFETPLMEYLSSMSFLMSVCASGKIPGFLSSLSQLKSVSLDGNRLEGISAVGGLRQRERGGCGPHFPSNARPLSCWCDILYDASVKLG